MYSPPKERDCYFKQPPFSASTLSQSTVDRTFTHILAFSTYNENEYHSDSDVSIVLLKEELERCQKLARKSLAELELLRDEICETCEIVQRALRGSASQCDLSSSHLVEPH